MDNGTKFILVVFGATLAIIIAGYFATTAPDLYTQQCNPDGASINSTWGTCE